MSSVFHKTRIKTDIPQTQRIMRITRFCICLVACLLTYDPEAEASPCCGIGVAAVGALAFAGGVVAGKHHHRHHGGGCHNCGCGGCGGSCGWCGGSYGKRKRRSLSGFLEEAEIQKAYEKIAHEDKDDCGLRLVCELAQRDPRELADDEIQILLPYRGLGESDGTTYGNYDEAAWHGQEGHSCPSHYPQCNFTASQIMAEYRKFVQNNGTFVP